VLLDVVIVRTTGVIRGLDEPLGDYVHHAAARLPQVAHRVGVTAWQVGPGDGAEAERGWVESERVEKRVGLRTHSGESHASGLLTGQGSAAARTLRLQVPSLPTVEMKQMGLGVTAEMMSLYASPGGL
jgi:hypothetical protein